MARQHDAYLMVPITEDERRKSREESRERLLEEARSYSSNDISSTGPPTRFPSLSERKSTSSSRPTTTESQWDRSRYQPVSPIEEESSQPQSKVPSQQNSFRSHRGYERVADVPDLWMPLWLRKSTLVMFALLFSAFIAALLTSRYFSNKYNGFHVAASTNHYVWTYVPTAVLVVVVSLWRQVDYQCKSLMPWDELRRGPVSASRSLLVDYISPIQIVSFVQAFKRRHIPVIVSIFVFFLLKVVVGTCSKAEAIC